VQAAGGEIRSKPGSGGHRDVFSRVPG